MSIVLTSREGRDKIITFQSRYLILVEGSDDRAVVANLITHEGLPADDFHIHNMIGKDGWPNALKGFMLTDGFENILSIGLMRDSDNNPSGTWQSCRDALANAGLPVPSAPDQLQVGPPAVIVTLVPSSTTQGALEELCWVSFDQGLRNCVDAYFGCAGNAAVVKAKEQVQVYLAGMNRPSRDLSIAAQRRALDYTSTAFDGLRNFVQTLAGATPGAAPVPAARQNEAATEDTGL